MAGKLTRHVRDFVRKTHWKLTRHVRDFVRKTHGAVTSVALWSFMVAVLALAVSVYELRANRTLRETTLFVMALDRLERARAMDERTIEERLRGRSTIGGEMASLPVVMLPIARAGQIRVLEEMVKGKISLRKMDLSWIDIRDAKLPSADLRDAVLKCTLLVGADLAGSNFESADSRQVNFSNANLDRVNFTSATLDGSIFSGGSLSRTDFSKASLQATRFSRVLLAGTDFTDAKFRNTRFGDVNLREARGLSQDQLNDACREGEDVQLPDDYFIEPCDRRAPQYYVRLCQR